MDTLKELKSQAYDCIVQVESWQRRLAETNQAIAAEAQKQAEVASAAEEAKTEDK